MGEMVRFASGGGEAEGYLARPASGSGPGVVVIQEWWGLNDQLKGVCDRFAGEGFVALTPDLYHGGVTDQVDEAGRLMMSLDTDRAAADLAATADHLVAQPGVSEGGIGVTGYCLGGGLALWLATLRPGEVRAVAPFYGVIPWPSVQPDYSRLQAPVQGHYAELDDFAGPTAVRKLEGELRGLGKECEFYIYPGTSHAFANEARPEVYNRDAAELAFSRTFEFFHRHLG